MTNVRMCDNCKQIIKDKQTVYLSLNMGGVMVTIDSHLDCIPDWMRSFHAEHIAKYKAGATQSPSTWQPGHVITF